MKKIIFAIMLAMPLVSLAKGDDQKSGTNQQLVTEEVVQQTSTILQGVIQNVENFQPLGGVTLFITSKKDKNIKKKLTTEKDGSFYISDLPAGIYTVKFQKPGFETGTYESLTVKEGGNNNFGFTLFPDK